VFSTDEQNLRTAAWQHRSPMAGWEQAAARGVDVSSQTGDHRRRLSHSEAVNFVGSSERRGSNPHTGLLPSVFESHAGSG
jgi:hypothetical protein